MGQLPKYLLAIVGTLRAHHPPLSGSLCASTVLGRGSTHARLSQGMRTFMGVSQFASGSSQGSTHNETYLGVSMCGRLLLFLGTRVGWGRSLSVELTVQQCGRSTAVAWTYKRR